MIRLFALILVAFGGVAVAAESSHTHAAPAGGPVVMSQVLVTSDQVEDVSSIEAWKRSFIKPGMSDRDKAMAIWTSVVKFRHQDAPPNEFIESMCVHDPIKCFNVYGYGICCCASGNMEELARAIGLPARGRNIGHCIPELQYDGGWHMLDASLIDWYPKADGTPASVDEISASVNEWEAARGGRMDDAAMNAFMRGGGWRKGPAVLATCPLFNDNGWLPARTHGWNAMINYYRGTERKADYEYGTAVGYRVNVQLRPGERLTRSWSNKGLHVNQRDGQAPGCIGGHIGEGDLAYAVTYGDLAPGRVGNGVHEWRVPLRVATLAKVALACDGVANAGDGIGPSGSKPGVLVLRVPSSYVFLAGEVTVDAAPGAGGSVALELSDDNGHAWKPVATLTKAGTATTKLDDLIFRKYDYRLRVTLGGAGTVLHALSLRHDVQHSERALPALAAGHNAIAFSSGDEGTITVQGCLYSEFAQKTMPFSAYAPVLEGLSANLLQPSGPTGTATIPITTPGDLKRLRVSAHYRARDAADNYEVTASFDAGKTWVAVGRLAGPTASNSMTFAIDAPPAPHPSREVLVRLVAHQSVTACVFDLRIDADYREPAAGFAPVKVTYVWDEAGKEHREVHDVRAASEKWTIDCATKPTMKDVIVELP